jgi:hypothetical protein
MPAPIADFADLFISVSEYLGRADFAHLFPRFVSMAELQIEREVRLADQQKSVTLTLVNNRATLPADFYSVRTVRTGDLPSVNLNQVSKHVQQQPSQATAMGYCFDNNEIVVQGILASTIVMDYFSTLPRLTAAAPSNWLLLRAPDAYLSGTLYHVMVWANDDRAGGVQSDFMVAIKSLKNNDKARRFVNGVMTVSGGLP